MTEETLPFTERIGKKQLSSEAVLKLAGYAGKSAAETRKIAYENIINPLLNSGMYEGADPNLRMIADMRLKLLRMADEVGKEVILGHRDKKKSSTLDIDMYSGLGYHHIREYVQEYAHFKLGAKKQPNPKHLKEQVGDAMGAEIIRVCEAVIDKSIELNLGRSI